MESNNTSGSPVQFPLPIRVLGMIAGWAMGFYCWSMIWLPGLAGLAVLFLFKNTPIRPRHFSVAIATTIAHLAWLTVAAATLNAWSVMGIDIALLSGAVVWLWVKPGKAPALFLGVVEAFSLVINFSHWTATSFGTGPHKALILHCVLRGFVIGLLWVGYKQMKRDFYISPVGQTPK